MAAEIFAQTSLLDLHDIGHMCHGGPFASVPLGNSGQATMNIEQDRKKI